MLNVYLLGVLVNVVVMVLFVTIGKMKLLKNKKAKIIAVLIMLGSFLTTLFVLGGLSQVIGTKITDRGIIKKNYKLYAIGKIMEFEYNKNTFSHFVTNCIIDDRRKKTAYRKSKIIDNYGTMGRYYNFVVRRYQAIKKANKR